MKKKIIIPVFITLWVVGLVFIGYMLSLIDTSQGSLLLNEASVRVIYKGIMVIVIATIAIGVILGKILDEITTPINELIQEAKLIAKGEYTHRIRYYSVEEVEELANSFDEMGEKLHRTIRKLKYQKTKAESVLSNLDEGIIVLNEDATIREMHHFAEQLLAIDKVPTCHISDILRDSKERAYDKRGGKKGYLYVV